MIYNSRKKLITIECPRCGCEYLPAEIYLPNQFLGRPYEIEKTHSGKIDMYDGDTMNLEEEYTCDKCGAKFRVVANVSFRTEEKNSISKFDTTYTSQLHTQKISLFEGN